MMDSLEDEDHMDFRALHPQFSGTMTATD